MEKELFRDHTWLSVHIILGVFILFIALLNLLPIADNLNPSFDSWVLFGIFSIIAFGFFLYSRFEIIITDQRLIFRKGWKRIQYAYSSIQEILVIDTPVFGAGGFGGPIRIEIPRSRGALTVTASYEWSTPWRQAKKSILILCKGAKENIVFPHPDADHIASLLKGLLL